MNHWVIYLKGYMTILVYGVAPWRFVTMCGNHHIYLWNVSQNKDGFVMNLSLADYKRIKNLLKKTGTKAVVLKEVGLPYFLFRMKRHSLFFICLAITCMLLFLSSLFVWDVKIYGNEYVSDNEIIRTLEESHVSVPFFSKTINYFKLEEMIREEFPSVSWISVKRDGSVLKIYLKEEVLKNIEMKNENETSDFPFYNIVSPVDGQIINIVVRRGIPKVKRGDSIEKNTILIEGNMPVYAEDGSILENQKMQAAGDVYISTKKEFHYSIPVEYERKDFTKRIRDVYKIRIGNLWIDLDFHRNPYDKFDEVTYIWNPITIGRYELPVSIMHCQKKEYTIMNAKYTEKQLLNISKNQNDLIDKKLLEKTIQIKQKDVTIKKYNKKWDITVWLQLIEKISE